MHASNLGKVGVLLCCFAVSLQVPFLHVASVMNVNALYVIGTRSVTYDNQPIGMYTTVGRMPMVV